MRYPHNVRPGGRARLGRVPRGRFLGQRAVVCVVAIVFVIIFDAAAARREEKRR